MIGGPSWSEMGYFIDWYKLFFIHDTIERLAEG